MSKNLVAKSRFGFSPAERFGCIMISEFTNGRKVRCHNGAVENLWSNVLGLGFVPKGRIFTGLPHCTLSLYFGERVFNADASAVGPMALPYELYGKPSIASATFSG
jgi:hypothetical protein